MSSLLLFSCQKNVSEAEINQNVVTENRDGESGINSGFCNSSGGSNCGPAIPLETFVQVNGCQIKVKFFYRKCRLSSGNFTHHIWGFEPIWSQSSPCNKIGYINNSIPVGGNGDWSAFLLQYNEFYSQITTAAEQLVLNDPLLFNPFTDQNVTLDWVETKCLKFCHNLYSIEDPNTPQWTELTCSLEGCCTRQTFWVFNFTTNTWEIHARNVIPGNLCVPEIQVECSIGSGSDCIEPCERL